MKKTFIALAVAIATIASGSTAIAQTTAATPQQEQTTPGDKKDAKVKKDRKGGKAKGDRKSHKGQPARRGNKAMAGGNAAACANLFEGIELSAKQQADMQALNESLKADRKAKAEQLKADRRAKAEKMKADRKALREKRTAERREYLAKLKSILTNEQYVKYLENSWMNKQQPSPRANKENFRAPGKPGPKIAGKAKND